MLRYKVEYDEANGLGVATYFAAGIVENGKLKHGIIYDGMDSKNLFEWPVVDFEPVDSEEGDIDYDLATERLENATYDGIVKDIINCLPLVYSDVADKYIVSNTVENSIFDAPTI